MNSASHIVEVLIPLWSGYVAVVAVFVTAPILVIVNDRKIVVGALAVLFLFASLLFTNVLATQVAGIKLIVYIIVWALIFICVQQKGWNYTDHSDEVYGLVLSAQTRFRIIAVIIVGLVGWQLVEADRLPFPIVSQSVTLGATQLVVQGLLLLAIARQPLKIGLGILVMFTGFGLLYSAVEPSLMVVGMLGVVDITVALTVCYLELLWKTNTQE
ncbi:MAG TPA: hypothetical protein DGN60_02435 [Chloroflexi bacterium]|nr:hypothetical protein [Chloroflexota bacterium]